jgi:hypothetical protein
MRDFNVHKFLCESLLREEEEEQVQQQAPAEPQQEVPETPEGTQQEIKAVTTPFDEFRENKIAKIEFEPGVGGGSLKIFMKESGRPVIISWQNNEATMQKPNGTVIELM